VDYDCNITFLVKCLRFQEFNVDIVSSKVIQDPVHRYICLRNLPRRAQISVRYIRPGDKLGSCKNLNRRLLLIIFVNTASLTDRLRAAGIAPSLRDFTAVVEAAGLSELSSPEVCYPFLVSV
jgi:hypothetical protein